MKTLTILFTSIFWLTAILAWSQNDLEITEAKYENYDPDEMFDWTNVAYSVYPISQLRPLSTSAKIKNLGVNAVSDVYLEVVLSDGEGLETIYLSNTIEIAAGDSTILEVEEFTPPNAVGAYVLSFTVYPTNDDNPENNSAVQSFEVSISEIARDSGSIEEGFTTTGNGEFRAGPAFQFTAPAEIHCMGVALSDLSELNAEFNIQLYDGTFQDSEPLAETNPGIALADIVNVPGSGESVFTWLFVEDGPYTVEENNALLPMFKYDGSGPAPIIGTSGYVPAQTNFLFVGEENTYYYSHDTYMVRLGLSEEFCMNQIMGESEYITVSGNVYHDVNCNEVMDPGENVISNRLIYNEDGIPKAYSNLEGNIAFYDVAGVEHLYFAETLPGFTTNTNTVYSEESTEITDVNFGYCAENEMADFGVNITSVGEPPRPGFPVDYEVCVSNYGTAASSIEVVFNFSNMLNASVIDADGGTVNENSIVWNMEDFGLFQTHCFSVSMQVAVGTPAGTILNPIATVQPAPPVFDVNVHNNEHSFVHEVVAAYDPNDKTVDYPVVNHTEIETGEGAELEYLIRFQNNGNFYATFVRVEDELPDLLDISSIEMIHASHDYELIFHEDQKVEWYFDNIMLPDSTTDEPGSHGHIHFRISTIPDVNLEDVITNSASIFFDFKDPVITEPAVTTFIDCSEGSLSILGVEPVCPGEALVLTTNRPEFDMLWSTEFSTISSPDFNFNAPDEPVEVTVLATHAVCTLSTSVVVPVIDIPETEISVEGSLLVATPGVSYTWYLDDEMIDWATEQSIVPLENGTYFVEVEYENGCIGTGELHFQSVGINDLNQADILLIPNPAGDFTQLILPEGKWQVSMIDVSGKLIFSEDQIVVNRYNIPLTQLAPGLYFVSVQSEEKRMVRKLVVE